MSEVLRQLTLLEEALIKGDLAELEVTSKSLILISKNNQEFQTTLADAFFQPSFRRLIFSYLSCEIKNNRDSESSIKCFIEAMEDVLRKREFDVKLKEKIFGVDSFEIFKSCMFRSQSIESSTSLEVRFLGTIIHSSYLFSSIKDRALTRGLVSSIIMLAKNDEFVLQNPIQVNLCLQLSGYIFKGMSVPVSRTNQEYFSQHILVLHKLHGRVTDKASALSLVHRNLIFCILSYLDKDESALENVITIVLANWPGTWAGNSPKEGLLMNEVESLLEHSAARKLLEPRKKTGELLNKLIEIISRSLGSEHSVICKKALLLWQNSKIFDLFKEIDNLILPQILPVVLTKAIHHWNETAKKMTASLLRKYYEAIETNDLFLDISAEILKFDRLHEQDKLNKYFEKCFEENGVSANAERVADADIVNEGLDRVIVPEKRLDLTVMNIVIGEDIGSGSFGTVSKSFKVIPGKLRKDWPKFAVKQIDKIHEELAMREIEFMNQVTHPNCVTLIGYYSTSQTINLVLEFAEKGDLHSVLVEMLSLELECVRFLAGEIASALEYFHQQDLVYGDLKPENVLIFGNSHAKLCDFGAVRKVSDLHKGADLEGTFIYLSPELAAGEAGSYASDFWSLGCLVYQMNFGKPPFSVSGERLVATDPTHQSFLFSGAAEPNNGMEYERLVPGDLSQQETEKQTLLDLISGLLAQDATDRIDFQGMENHELFESFSSRGISLRDLHAHKAPEIKSSLELEQRNQATQGAWTQRAYSMMIAPIPQKHSFEEGSEWSMRLIPENPGEDKLLWSSSRGGLPVVDFRAFKPDFSRLNLDLAGDDPSKEGILESKMPLGRIPGRNLRKQMYQNSAMSIMKNRGYGQVPISGRPRQGQRPVQMMTVAPNQLSAQMRGAQNAGRKNQSKKSEGKSKYMVNEVDLSAG